MHFNVEIYFGNLGYKDRNSNTISKTSLPQVVPYQGDESFKNGIPYAVRTFLRVLPWRRRGLTPLLWLRQALGPCHFRVESDRRAVFLPLSGYY